MQFMLQDIQHEADFHLLNLDKLFISLTISYPFFLLNTISLIKTFQIFYFVHFSYKLNHQSLEYCKTDFFNSNKYLCDLFPAGATPLSADFLFIYMYISTVYNTQRRKISLKVEDTAI